MTTDDPTRPTWSVQQGLEILKRFERVEFLESTDSMSSLNRTTEYLQQ